MALLRSCYRQLGLLQLERDVERSVVSALQAASPGPGAVLLAAGRQANLPPDAVAERASVAFLNFAAFNLSDDLSDGDCSYIAPREGPAVLLILLSLFQLGLRGLTLPRETESRVIADLIAAEAAQVIEISTSNWDVERLTRVTDGIAGRQWSAYLTVLWAGTGLENSACDVALALGRVALLAGDIRTHDPRYTTLTPLDRTLAIEQALSSARELEVGGLESFSRPVAAAKRALVGELARLGAEAAVRR